VESRCKPPLSERGSLTYMLSELLNIQECIYYQLEHVYIFYYKTPGDHYQMLIS
jgi:hypothetical protein